MKMLANEARKEMMNTGRIKVSPSAKETYKGEVDSLVSSLNIALKNAPRERQAQIIPNTAVNAKKRQNPDMTKAEIKKASQQALTSARIKVGAQRTPITISDRQWEAIQAGAVSDNILSQILKYTDIDQLRQRATPHNSKGLSPTQVTKIKAMLASGYNNAEIAEALGVSATTVGNYAKGKE